MKLGDVVSESVFCSIGCITKPEDIDTLQSYLEYNRPVIEKFKTIVVAHTKTDNVSDDDFRKYNEVWKNAFGSVVVITRPNFGHTFGFTGLDDSVLSYVKSLEFGNKWVWKSTNDILIEPQIFDVEMGGGEFFYFQGHGITGINTYYQGSVDKAVENFKNDGYEYFFPQTNFYIIKSSIDCLINSIEFDRLYKKCINDPDYSKNKIQTEYKYLLCECILRDCVYRNKLKCKHLISNENYRQLLQSILTYRIADSSHKNIFFKECGVCHFHFPNEQVIEI